MTTSTELGAVLDVVRNFIDREVVPVEAEFLAEGFGGVFPRLQELRRRVKEMGLWVPHLPEQVGGPGLSLVEFAQMSEQLGRTPLGHFVFNAQAPDVGNMELLLGHGSTAQKRQWLYPLIDGEIRSCFSMTEPGRAGSNPTWMATTATRDGDRYVINGDKWFTTAAEGAAFTIVMAVTNPQASELHRRASMIIVPTDTPGFELVRNTSVMGETGSGWASHAEVAFTDCRVPVGNRIGDEGAGFVLAQERLGPGRIHHCMRWIGICERSIEIMCRHAVDRELAPGRPLASRQVVQHWIADSRAEANASRLMVLDAASKIEREGIRGARTEVSAIKFYVANTLGRVLDRALQTLGGMGMTDYTPIAFWYRHERAARIYDGVDEVHRNLVARTELAKYGYQGR
ncbi:(R)-benzylsuccinyl-CoA dehydrogenase [bacterium BMS3Abin02]|nr:(R)-benzylsuccinyl-CoA dehydrogenase [bacterium BMS3Abin02]GBE21123.1 (R)-benzylsuccinyl-CoA dehydrogenase [bacterium BMS3Bbin01]